MTITNDFVFAGKAIFVVRNPKGESVTLRVRKADERINPSTGQPFPESFFVACRRGNDAWSYVGVVGRKTTDRSVKTTRKSDPNADRERRVAEWALLVIDGQKALPAGYEIHHTGRCGRCAKLLRDPQSVERGIGPECIKHMVVV